MPAGQTAPAGKAESCHNGLTAGGSTGASIPPGLTEQSFLYADGNPYNGPQAVAEGVFQRIVADVEDLTVRPVHYIDAGQTVVVEGRYRGRVRATGSPVDAQFAHVWQLRDGKVVRFQQYTDTKQGAEAFES